jgi:hypothetical protein
MNTRDIHEQIKELYRVEVSAELVSKITERIVPEIKEWQNRPLEKVYPFLHRNDEEGLSMTHTERRQQWKARIEIYRASGLSAKQFCKQHNISINSCTIG